MDNIFQKKKAQVAIEFLMMVSLALIMMIMLGGVLHYLSYHYSEEKNLNRLMDFGYSLQSELILASQVSPGYERVIEIPDRLQGAGYSISQTNNSIVISYKEAELVFQIPEVSGSFAKGSNTIRKISDEIVMIS